MGQFGRHLKRPAALTSQGFGLARMNLPYLIGTFFTPKREKAKIYGFVIHLLNGWMFFILYILLFAALHMANWWFGLVLGLAHALVMLTVGMSLMPGIHGWMASEQHGPNSERQLEPPGFMALNYGIRTPIWVLPARAVFGAL